MLRQYFSKVSPTFSINTLFTTIIIILLLLFNRTKRNHFVKNKDILYGGFENYSVWNAFWKAAGRVAEYKERL